MQEGKLTPGSEVVEVKHAGLRVIFVIALAFCRLWLSIKARRRYAIARRSRVKWGSSVLVLVMHVKDVTGTDAEITGKQNRQIKAAEVLYDECSKNGRKLS